MSTFIFEKYNFDKDKLQASFYYSFDGKRKFVESIQFNHEEIEYDEAALDKALFLAFLLIGTSYYKTFPTNNIELRQGQIDAWQAEFLNMVYQEGLSQFAFENGLARKDLAHFIATRDQNLSTKNYEGTGTISLQSGGKDSLLTAELLKQKQHKFSAFYISSNEVYPEVLNEIHSEILTARRQLDLKSIKSALEGGGKNGHVPVTYIVLSIALIQAILLNKKTILTSIGHEGEEPHEWIGDLPVNHQWSKTWPAEKNFVEYVKKYISPDIQVGSPLRQYSELRIAELFANNAWAKFGKQFSSCNRANYEQGTDNTKLKWCGECPKCANAFLLFAPFIEAKELKSLFNGKDLFAKPLLAETFKGLLGVDNVMKPFECVGEIDELRLAYHKSQQRGGYEKLPFEVPDSSFDYMKEYPAQDWAKGLVLQNKTNNL